MILPFVKMNFLFLFFKYNFLIKLKIPIFFKIYLIKFEKILYIFF